MIVKSKPAVIGFLAGWFFLVSSVLVIACCDACVTVPHRDATQRTNTQQDEHAVVIETACASHDDYDATPFLGDKPVGGSGVLIDGRHIITAKHVVACPYIPNVHATLSNGRRIRVVVVHELANIDLALLEVASAEVLDVAPPVLATMPRPGERARSVHAWPDRDGEPAVVREVYEQPKCKPARNGGEICFTAWLQLLVYPGNSGSALYDDRGNLVGIVIGGSFVGTPELAFPAGDGYAVELWRYRGEVMP